MRAPTFEQLMIAAEILSLLEPESGDPTSPASTDASACHHVADWLEHEAKKREANKGKRQRRRMSGNQ